jgi:hypothetical protein
MKNPRRSNLNSGAWSRRSGTPGARGSSDLNRQFVVAYGRGPATQVYPTAYTFADAREALRRCIAQHGPWGARIAPALSGHPPAL